MSSQVSPSSTAERNFLVDKSKKVTFLNWACYDMLWPILEEDQSVVFSMYHAIQYVDIFLYDFAIFCKMLIDFAGLGEM